MRFQAEPLLFALATTAGAWPTLTSPSSLNLHIRIPGLSSFFNKLTHRQDTSNSIILLPGEAGYTTDTIATPTPSTSPPPLTLSAKPNNIPLTPRSQTPRPSPRTTHWPTTASQKTAPAATATRASAPVSATAAPRTASAAARPITALTRSVTGALVFRRIRLLLRRRRRGYEVGPVPLVSFL